MAGPYRPRPDDPDHDRISREITGLVIPVPEAQPFAVHPHVTLLAPFGSRARVDDPALHTELQGFFGSVAPFDFALVEVRKFPAGVLLPRTGTRGSVPRPDDALARRATRTSRRTRASSTDVIPHLTLDEDAHPEPLPIRARARRSRTSSTRTTGAWNVVAQFRLER